MRQIFIRCGCWVLIKTERWLKTFSCTTSACSPSFSRVDADCISPDVKNSIHVGDRILEINGTPIHNVPLDEVFTTLSAHCYRNIVQFLNTQMKPQCIEFFSVSSSTDTTQNSVYWWPRKQEMTKHESVFDVCCLNSLLLSRSTCWSRRRAGCCSSPSSTTLTVRDTRVAPQRLKSRWTVPCRPLCQGGSAPSCPSPSPLTPTSATWNPTSSRKNLADLVPCCTAGNMLQNTKI